MRKWHTVENRLEEAGERLFAFTKLDPANWKPWRPTNAIERLTEEFCLRIKTQTILACAKTVPMLLSALMGYEQITMRKVDGRQTHDKLNGTMPLDRARAAVVRRELPVQSCEF